jgi:hypothetical protein
MSSPPEPELDLEDDPVPIDPAVSEPTDA